MSMFYFKIHNFLQFEIKVVNFAYTIFQCSSFDIKFVKIKFWYHTRRFPSQDAIFTFCVTYFLFSIMSTTWLNTSSFLSWKSNTNCLIPFWYMLIYWGLSLLNADEIQNLAVSNVAFQLWYAPAGVSMQYIV